MAQFASNPGQILSSTERAGVAQEAASVVASPTPLGLLTLAFTTALIGCSYANFLVPNARTGINLAVGAALFFGGIVQILAGMWEFRRNNTLSATVFSSYGGFLVAFGVLFLPNLGLVNLFGNALAFNHALGLLFLCWTICAGILFLGSMRTNGVFAGMLGLLALSYLFLTIGAFADANTPLLMIGGWIGVACALVAWYGALAGIMKASNSALKLPLGSSRG